MVDYWCNFMKAKWLWIAGIISAAEYIAYLLVR